MKSISIHQRLRPLRYAFMVRSGDANAALTAVSLNTVIWGGIYNPIVPTEPEATCLGLLKTFDPDYLVNLTPNSLAERLTDKFKHRVLTQSELFRPEPAAGTHRRLALGFGMGLIVRHIHKNELGEGTKPSPAAYLGTIPDDWEKYTTFVFGGLSGLPDGGRLFSDYYQELLTAVKVEFEPTEDRDFRQLRFPIDATGYGIRRFGGEGSFSSHIVYIGHHSNIDDLIEFWNIRCTGREICFVPIAQYRNHRQMIERTVKDGCYRYGLNMSVENRTDIQKGTSLSEPLFTEVCEWLRGLNIGPMAFRDWGPRFGQSIPFYVGDIHAAMLEAEKTYENALLHDGHITPVKLIRSSYIQDDRLIGDHRYAIEIIPSVVSSDEWTCRLPCAPGLEDLLSRHGSHDAVRVSSAGVVVSPKYASEHLFIQPIRTFEVIASLFQHAIGRAVKFSHAGRYADRIIHKMGSLQFGCRVFKLKGVREVITKLSNGASLKRGDICSIIRRTSLDAVGSRNWIDELYNGFGIGHGTWGSDINGVFDYLLEAKVLRPGLDCACSNCFGSDWYHISEINEEYVCHYCLERQRIHFGSKPDWHFKSDGLFRLRDSAQGSLAVILSLWRLSQDHFVTDDLYTTSLQVGPGKELDFCWLGISSLSTAYELVLGEARNFFDYNDADVEKLAQLADKFEQKPFLAFSTLKDRFADSEKVLLRGLTERGYLLLPFTRFELDPYDIWSRFDDKYIRPANLSRLSELLVQTNLSE